MQYVDIVVAVCFTAAALPCIRLLQTIGYMPQRGYYKLLYSPYYASIVILGAILYFVQWSKWQWTPLLACALALTLSFVYILHFTKPRLVFTNRAIRLVVFSCFACYGMTWCMPYFAVCLLLPFAVLVAWLITLPYELAVYQYYFNKARKKIAKKQAEGMQVIGITGSYGKTSVKLILSQLLTNSIATPDSCNTPMGIARFVNGGGLDSDHIQYFIAEMGARRKGDIARLCKLVCPNHAILTGLAPQHLSTFRNFDNIVKEKSKLLSCIGSDGCAVLNGADHEVRKLANICKCNIVITQSDDFCHTVQNITADGTEMQLTAYHATYNFTIPLLGVANADNVAVAIAMCVALGNSLDDLTQRCQHLQQIPHRMSVIRNGTLTVIDDGYNANIEGIARCCATLDYLSDFKIVVAQGIVECGKQTAFLNTKAGELLGKSCDVVIATGVNSNNIVSGAERAGCKTVLTANSLNHAVKMASQYYKSNTVVLFQNDIPQ